VTSFMPLSKESSPKGCSQQNPPEHGGHILLNNPRAKTPLKPDLGDGSG
jgi:hypothetical protein